MMTAFTFTGWAFWAAFASVLLMLSGWKRVMPERWHLPELRQLLLLAFSLGFYALVGGQLVGLLAASILVNHFLTRAMWSQQGPLRHLLLGAGILLARLIGARLQERRYQVRLLNAVVCPQPLGLTPCAQLPDGSTT